MRTETPVQIKLSDYQPYPFAMDEVELTFELAPSATKVHAKIAVRKLAESPLKLDGIALQLDEVRLNGAKLEPGAYQLTDESLTLKDLPDTFTLATSVTIDPSANTALSGLYISSDRFCTQCESVGFRRITFWPDRPDVMSRFKVRIEAEKAPYPILLSNGTPGATGDLGDGEYFIRITRNQDPNDKAALGDNNGRPGLPEDQIVDGGFLELVRYGVRAWDAGNV